MDGESKAAMLEEPVVRTGAVLTPNKNIGYRFVKRTFDVITSAVGLIICIPIFLIVGFAIKIEDPKGKIFYHQPRIGLNGTTFYCHKLRSMCSEADEIKASLMGQNEMDGPVFKIRDDPRVTRVGRVIRRLSIDELPQLWNVFVGDMSLVGPRPLPVAEELACTRYQRQRELVKPGITCYWQVSGRNNVFFDEWIALDFKYIREQSAWIDIKLLLSTVPAVLKAKGAS